MHRMLAAHIFHHIRANRCIRIRPMIAAEPRRIDAGQTEHDLAVWTAALVFRLVVFSLYLEKEIRSKKTKWMPPVEYREASMCLDYYLTLFSFD